MDEVISAVISTILMILNVLVMLKENFELILMMGCISSLMYDVTVHSQLRIGKFKSLEQCHKN